MIIVTLRATDRKRAKRAGRQVVRGIA